MAAQATIDIDDRLERAPEAQEKGNRVFAMRSKINLLLDQFEAKGFSSREEVSKFREAAKSDSSADDLEGYHAWIKSKWKDAEAALSQINSSMEKGIREKFMSDEDRAFLMENLVLTDKHDFVSRENQKTIQKLLQDKMVRMKKDRKEFDEFRNDPLIRNTGFLKTDANTKLDIPDEKKFLKMSAPERRKLLEEAKKALPNAQEYAEKHDSAESEKMTAEYHGLLEKARKEKIMGKDTADKFMDGFKKIDVKEKEEWLNEMKNGSQLQRYRELWKNIQKTLKGKSLEDMEKMREKLGFNELSQKFEQIQRTEEFKMLNAYQGKLNTEFSQGNISRHSYYEFLEDMRRQPLNQKQHYLDEFENQMAKYRTLRNNINGLSKAAQESFDEMYEGQDFGYSEIKAKFDRINSQSTGKQTKVRESERAKSAIVQVTNETIKKNIIFADETLDRTGKEGFIRKISTFFDEKITGQQDASSYLKTVRKARTKHQKKTEEAEMQEEITEDVGGARLADEEVEMIQYESLEAPVRKQSRSHHKIKTNNDHAFRENVFEERGKQKKVVRVSIGSKEAIQAFNAETSLNSKKDRLSLMAGGQEMKLHDIRNMNIYLKEKLGAEKRREEEIIDESA